VSITLPRGASKMKGRTALAWRLFFFSRFSLLTSHFALGLSLGAITAGSLLGAELEPVAPPAGDHRLGHPPPAIDPVDQTYLIRFVRRAIEQQIREGRSYEPEYIPPGLSEVRCRAGITTAVYLEGCVDAARTAETLGDRQRAERYREAARKAARFVIQLQFRPQECFYVQSPKEVVGGVRNSPADPTLRIDHSQHALAALLRTAGLLGAQTRPTSGQP